MYNLCKCSIFLKLIRCSFSVTKYIVFYFFNKLMTSILQVLQVVPFLLHVRSEGKRTSFRVFVVSFREIYVLANLSAQTTSPREHGFQSLKTSYFYKCYHHIYIYISYINQFTCTLIFCVNISRKGKFCQTMFNK